MSDVSELLQNYLLHVFPGRCVTQSIISEEIRRMAHYMKTTSMKMREVEDMKSGSLDQEGLKLKERIC